MYGRRRARRSKPSDYFRNFFDEKRQTSHELKKHDPALHPKAAREAGAGTRCKFFSSKRTCLSSVCHLSIRLHNEMVGVLFGLFCARRFSRKQADTLVSFVVLCAKKKFEASLVFRKEPDGAAAFAPWELRRLLVVALIRF